MELAGRVVLVTGAAGGIGSAIAEVCAEQGAHVAAVDRVPPRFGPGETRGSAGAGAGETRGSAGAGARGEQPPVRAPDAEALARITPFVADLSTPEGCAGLVAEVTDRLGEVSGLVNCAGVMRRGDILTLSEDDWAATFAVNVDAVVRLCRAVLPTMVASGAGAIVNIASQWGLMPAAGHVAYNCSKAAVVSISRSLARDHGEHGVRVNAICPGEILTPMVAQKLSDSHTSEAELAASIPLGRLGRPREVAELSSFLLSDRASFISGAAVEITGAQQVG
ncbi:NAD(P)-dependent dehydrogenase (short-subunit alcohol dehydrogenase family) [Brevibacterium sanguinis]|uniref:NAD(P)-dependent dehydrogenase (Short-subunit alcohol dehydrogenase family) n=2 Tax=Brevibacterium TaxID=1696 RepID=A0A366IL85_9MICO|nr:MULTISPECIES: SDR family NAD(P)-dependent oxidoreductase [Brevibacterium]RBP65724.1 NAD(P)-dependent dehydrogenase (short-subunit alcohol dehydrogenase family) [Brevibacterium sanguinis]RBP72358.1 NAD(P)-dependent dehydrogenase (short-subunit alcohol dehydrogenase family) [Brevibacterium celere]